MNPRTVCRALPGLALALTTATLADSSANVATTLPSLSTLLQSGATTSAPPAARPSVSIFDEMYLLADVGVAIPQDANIKNIASTATSGGLSGTKVSLNTGMRFDAGLGFNVTDWLAVEVASGLIWNSVDRVEGTILDTTGGLLGADLPLSGGSGDIYNVPIMFNGQVRLPVGKDLKLLLGGGIGTVWSDASVDSITTTAIPGLQAAVSGNSWAFAYQANVGLEWELAKNLALGVRYSFLGTTEVNYGPASFNTPTIVGVSDVKADAIYTHSILATLKLEF